MKYLMNVLLNTHCNPFAAPFLLGFSDMQPKKYTESNHNKSEFNGILLCFFNGKIVREKNVDHAISDVVEEWCSFVQSYVNIDGSYPRRHNIGRDRDREKRNYRDGSRKKNAKVKLISEFDRN